MSLNENDVSKLLSEDADLDPELKEALELATRMGTFEGMGGAVVVGVSGLEKHKDPIAYHVSDAQGTHMAILLRAAAAISQMLAGQTKGQLGLTVYTKLKGEMLGHHTDWLHAMETCPIDYGRDPDEEKVIHH